MSSVSSKLIILKKTETGNLRKGEERSANPTVTKEGTGRVDRHARKGDPATKPTPKNTT